MNVIPTYNVGKMLLGKTLSIYLVVKNVIMYRKHKM